MTSMRRDVAQLAIQSRSLPLTAGDFASRLLKTLSTTCWLEPRITRPKSIENGMHILMCLPYLLMWGSAAKTAPTFINVGQATLTTLLGAKLGSFAARKGAPWMVRVQQRHGCLLQHPVSRIVRSNGCMARCRFFHAVCPNHGLRKSQDPPSFSFARASARRRMRCAPAGL